MGLQDPRYCEEELEWVAGDVDPFVALYAEIVWAAASTMGAGGHHGQVAHGKVAFHAGMEAKSAGFHWHR